MPGWSHPEGGPILRVAPCPAWSNPPHGGPIPRVVQPQGGPNPRVAPSPERSHPCYGGDLEHSHPQLTLSPTSSPLHRHPTATSSTGGDAAPRHGGQSWTKLLGGTPRCPPLPARGQMGSQPGRDTPPLRCFPETLPARASSFHYGWDRWREWPPALIGHLPPHPLLPGLARMARPCRTPKRGLRPCPLPISPFTGATEAAS